MAFGLVGIFLGPTICSRSTSDWARGVAGGEVLLDALGRGRRRRAEEIGAKLYAVRPVVDPPPARLHEFAGANRRRVADDRDQIAMAARLDTQHAEPAVLVVKGDALDETGEVFAVRCSGSAGAGLFHSC